MFDSRLCEKEGVDFLEISRSRDDPYKIDVCGHNASNIANAISDYTTRVNSKFKVVTHDFKGYHWFYEYQGDKQNSPKNIILQVFRLNYSHEKEMWLKNKSVMCELLLFGTNEKSSQAHEAMFVAFPAHLVLSDIDCLKLLQNNKGATLSNLRETLLYGDALYELHIQNVSVPLELLKPPMIAYEHYYSHHSVEESKKDHIKFMKDMAIARLDETKLNPELRSEIIRSVKEKNVYENSIGHTLRVSDSIMTPEPNSLKAMAQAGVRFRIGLNLQIPAFLFANHVYEWQMDAKAPQGKIRAKRLELVTDKYVAKVHEEIKM